jgi:PAS domain-containing protein
MAGPTTSSGAGAHRKPPRNKKAAVPPPAPRCEHILQFYEAERFLYDSISQFILPSFFSNESASVIIATQHHLDSLEVHLREQNLIPAQLKDRGQLMFLDADEILATIMPGGKLDLGIFENYLRSFFSEIKEKYPRILVYGELVNILCERGDFELARQLEVVWERFLAEAGDISLLCGYNMNAFEAEGLSEVFQQICLNHSQVEPTEKMSPSLVAQANQKTTIAMLQQKSKCLEAEVTRRKMSETAFNMVLEHLGSSSRGPRQQNEPELALPSQPVGIVGRTVMGDRVRYFVNQYFCQISGLDEQEIQHDGNWLSAVHHLDLETVKRVFSFEDGRMRKQEYRFVHPNGDIRWVSSEITITASGYVHTIVDITSIRENGGRVRWAPAETYGEHCSPLAHHKDLRPAIQTTFHPSGSHQQIPDSVLRWSDSGHSKNPGFNDVNSSPLF